MSDDVFNLALLTLLIYGVLKPKGPKMASSVKLQIIKDNLSVEARAAALAGIREVLTEENTDALIERLVAVVKPKLPIYLRWLPLGTVLDALLPGALLDVFVEALG